MSIRYYVSTEEASFFRNNSMGYADKKPITGTYKVGDFVISSTQKDGIFGWVCTVAGTPGEWEVIGSGSTSGFSGGGSVVGYINTVSFSTPKTSIEIGIPEFNYVEDFLEVHYNGLLLAEGIHYKISADGLKIEAINETWNESADDTQQMIFRVLKSQGINIQEFTNTIDISSSCYRVDMGLEYDNKTDIVEVHLNGVMLVKDLDYKIEEGNIVKIDESEAWNPYNVNGQKMFVKIIRNVGFKIIPEEGSVTIESLSPELAEDMRAIDGVLTVIDTQNTNIANMNNKVEILEGKVDGMDLSNYVTKSELNPYQEKNSTSLATNSKDIVGAINEVFQLGVNVKQNLVDALIAKGASCSTSDSFMTLINLIYGLGNSVGNDGDGGWSALTAMGVAKTSVGVCTDGTKIYCLGGLNTSNTATNLFTCYDTTTDKWETLAPIPINIFGASCIYKDDDRTIRVFSKMDTPNSKASIIIHYKYDIAGNTWTNLSFADSTNTATVMPLAVFYDNASSGRYVMLVFNNTGNYVGIKLWTALTGFDFIYQTSAHSTFLISSANCYHNGRVYSIGGIDTDGTLYNQTLALDIGSNTMMELTSIPEPIAGASAEVYDNKIYVFGGYVISNSVTQLNDKIFVYDISNNVWNTLYNSMSIPRCNAGSCIIGNKIYVIGGDTGDANIEVSLNPLTNVDVFVIDENMTEEPVEPVYDTFLLKDGKLVTNGAMYDVFGDLVAAGGVYVEGNYLKLSFSYNKQVISFNKYIEDFSKYTTINVTMYSDSSSSTPYLYANQLTNAGVSGSFTNSNSPQEHNYDIKQLTNNSTKHTYTFDISDWNREGYLGFTAANDMKTGTIYITDIEIL